MLYTFNYNFCIVFNITNDLIINLNKYVKILKILKNNSNINKKPLLNGCTFNLCFKVTYFKIEFLQDQN